MEGCREKECDGDSYAASVVEDGAEVLDEVTREEPITIDEKSVGIKAEHVES